MIFLISYFLLDFASELSFVFKLADGASFGLDLDAEELF
jgi:hypothetical protein